MEGFPFDSQLEYNPETGEPVYDRAVSSQPLRKLIKDLFSTGVMPNPSTCFQVSADGSSMNVTVAAGFAVVDGGLVRETEATTLEVDASDTSLTRIDSVVLKWDENVDVRLPSLYVKKGTASASPVRPSLQRDNSIYEIGLADITVGSNVSVITNGVIADTRAETGRCGYVSSVSEWDTTTIYQQIQSDLAEFKSNEESDFADWSEEQQSAYETWSSGMEADIEAWLEEIKDIIDEDTAVHLQNEIDGLVTSETYTLLASGWSNGEYSLESVYSSSDYDIIGITPSESATSSQRSAWSKADCGGYYATNKIVAHKTVPSVDIPVGIVLKAKYITEGGE